MCIYLCPELYDNVFNPEKGSSLDASPANVLHWDAPRHPASLKIALTIFKTYGIAPERNER